MAGESMTDFPACMTEAGCDNFDINVRLAAGDFGPEVEQRVRTQTLQTCAAAVAEVPVEGPHAEHFKRPHLRCGLAARWELQDIHETTKGTD